MLRLRSPPPLFYKLFIAGTESPDSSTWLISATVLFLISTELYTRFCCISECFTPQSPHRAAHGHLSRRAAGIAVCSDRAELGAQ